MQIWFTMWLMNTILRTESYTTDSVRMVIMDHTVLSCFFVSNVHHYSIPFVNSSFPYAIDPAHLSPAGPSVASLKLDCGVKFGPAQRKGLLKWQQVFIVLRPEDDTLYEFRTDLVRNKESFIYL